MRLNRACSTSGLSDLGLAREWCRGRPYHDLGRCSERSLRDRSDPSKFALERLKVGSVTWVIGPSSPAIAVGARCTSPGSVASLSIINCAPRVATIDRREIFQ